MAWLSRTFGIVLIVIAAVDIFMTVLYPRTGKSILSMPISRGTWNIFRQVSRWSKSESPVILLWFGNFDCYCCSLDRFIYFGFRFC